ncbi:MAG: metallophosphoesterase [Anaerolineae bacterium]|jgi:hypothetical protein|nr:metallophosphoesterase [Anaerolineae bacterium]MBT7074112.1 metallophosphoesterase [Anaerolineae bacterium]
MQFEWTKKYKVLAILLIVGGVFFAGLSLNYIQWLKNALISSTESYKTELSRLERENIKLEDLTKAQELDIIVNREYITNGVSVDYIFQISPSDLSLNNFIVEEKDNTEAIRLIITGHPYGSPSNQGSITPSSTLVDAVDEINQREPDLFFTLGDLAYAPSEESFDELDERFLSKVDAPIFNAPGNHDFYNGREFYEEKFGQSFYYFKYGQIQVIILDTEVGHCAILGRQREMLEQAITSALDDNKISSVFIFFHKTLFLEKKPELISQVNGPCEYGRNYSELESDLFISAAQEKPLYLIAGDVGASGGNLSPFYYKYPDINLYTLAVGLGDSPNDVLLQVDILPSSDIELELIAIGGNEFSRIETYTPAYWTPSE